ncbi:ATP-binding protein [Solibacillus silvestris]
MQPPYEECASCVAVKWCSRYKGDTPKPATPTWCNPKYRLDKALSLTNLPKRYLNANKHNYKLNDNNRTIAETLKPYLLNIVEAVDEGKNFLFKGPTPGTGKTFHASMLLNEYIYKTCLSSRMDFENPMAYFVSYATLMDELRYSKDDDELGQVMERVKNVPLLIMDDVGSGTTSPFTNEQTFILLNHRYNNSLSTIFTTNLSGKHLLTALNARIVSRMSSNCVEIDFSGSDLRSKE